MAMEVTTKMTTIEVANTATTNEKTLTLTTATPRATDLKNELKPIPEVISNPTEEVAVEETPKQTVEIARVTIMT